MHMIKFNKYLEPLSHKQKLLFQLNIEVLNNFTVFANLFYTARLCCHLSISSISESLIASCNEKKRIAYSQNFLMNLSCYYNYLV